MKKLDMEQINQDSNGNEGKKGSPINFGEAIRMPNIKQYVSKNGETKEDQGHQSPTSILEGQKIFANFLNQDKPSMNKEFQGEMLRKSDEGKFRKYWFSLIGKEIYCYKKKNDKDHKTMHNLLGVYISEEPDEQLTPTLTLFPIKLIFPPSKARTYYL
mmetsp:Transcript_29481/g.28635  ORF Transcript_29481/g.28635 Transcript_29481/m.28635 type:complete len:158 (+) Transcript_29481:1187-1660(+)